MNWDEAQIKLKKAVDVWFTEQCFNPYGDFYLFYRATDITDGDFIISIERPEGWDFGSRRIGSGTTTEQAYRILLDNLRQLPILS